MAAQILALEAVKPGFNEPFSIHGISCRTDAKIALVP
jgi:hypothetical protein